MLEFAFHRGNQKQSRTLRVESGAKLPRQLSEPSVTRPNHCPIKPLVLSFPRTVLYIHLFTCYLCCTLLNSPVLSACLLACLLAQPATPLQRGTKPPAAHQRHEKSRFRSKPNIMRNSCATHYATIGRECELARHSFVHRMFTSLTPKCVLHRPHPHNDASGLMRMVNARSSVIIPHQMHWVEQDGWLYRPCSPDVSLAARETV